MPIEIIKQKNESATALKILVAAGHVSQEKVDQSIELARTISPLDLASALINVEDTATASRVREQFEIWAVSVGYRNFSVRDRAGSERFGEYCNEHVQIAWQAFLAAIVGVVSHDTIADLVVRNACETDPADPDDPETIKILRSDLRWVTLSALLAANTMTRKRLG